MNKSEKKQKRNKLVSIRVDENLFNDCLKQFKNNLRLRCANRLTGSSADLIEYLLQQYRKLSDSCCHCSFDNV